MKQLKKDLKTIIHSIELYEQELNKIEIPNEQLHAILTHYILKNIDTQIGRAKNDIYERHSSDLRA